MVAYIIGNFLVKQKIITIEQLSDVLREQKKVRAKLGLIAVSEDIMSYDEARAILAMSDTDKEFADYAMEIGYLSDGQIKNLLRRQGNAYMSFAQTLENQRLLNIEQLEQYLMDFKVKNDLTFTDLEDLKSDDVNRILPMFFPYEAGIYIDAACAAVRTLIRHVDSDIYPLRAFMTDSFEAANGAVQFVKGEKVFSYAIVGKGKELTLVASRYMRENFEDIDEDTLDTIGELINCISGIYATELSQNGVILDMLPPKYYTQMSMISARDMLILPLIMRNETIYLIICMGNQIDIR